MVYRRVAASCVLVAALEPAHAKDAARSNVVAQTAFYGYATPEPALWVRKPRDSVIVRFCARGVGPVVGSVVTLVPASTTLPSVIVRVTGEKKHHRASCTVVNVEPVKQQQWLQGDWSQESVWANPRLIVVVGEKPKARGLEPRTLTGTTLPPGTSPGDIRIAVDLDGDDRVDVLARYACEDGSRNCEEFGCQEVWSRKKDGSWEREDQICGED
jgi:hypothetical protein